MEKSIIKLIWNFKGPQIAKTIYKKKNEVNDAHFLTSKLVTKLW